MPLPSRAPGTASTASPARAAPWPWLVLAGWLPLVACGGAESDGLTEGLAGSGGASAGSSGAGGSGTGGSAGGQSGSAGAANAGGSSAVVPVPIPDAGTCNASVVASSPASFEHLTQCSPIAYDTNPPSGGPHYAIWPAFQSYGFALPPGFLVHALEHGAVVFWYNCPEGCADEVAEVEAFIAGLPEDPLCSTTSAPRRTVLVPNLELGTRWAASAWGYALTADCFDSGVFGEFYAEHYGNGREAVCAPGQAFTESPCP